MSSDSTVTDYDPSQAPQAQLSVTPAALAHLREQLAKAGGDSVRLGVEESGCNGFMYTIDFDAKNASETEEDQRFDFAQEVVIRVAKAHWPMVAGTELDYIQEGLNRVLKFKNPNAQSHCGCGESFSIDS